jgi:uncharacterized protein with GYD domain
MMQRFVMTMRLTARGARNVEQLPSFCDAFRASWREAGGKLDHLDLVQGEYDLVACGTLPSAMVALQLTLAVIADGMVTVQTSASFDYREASEATALVPKRHQTLMPESKQQDED